jgi:hypothetical protein
MGEGANLFKGREKAITRRMQIVKPRFGESDPALERCVMGPSAVRTATRRASSVPPFHQRTLNNAGYR